MDCNLVDDIFVVSYGLYVLTYVRMCSMLFIFVNYL